MLEIFFIKPFTSLHKNQNLEVPLGLMYLSAYCKKEFGSTIATSLYDLRLTPGSFVPLFDAIREKKPAVIGISMMNFEKPFLAAHLSTIRRLAPKTLIVLGGAYPSCNTDEALLSFPEVDLAVIGEGEKTFCAIISALLSGSSIYAEPGIAYRKGNAVVYTEPRPLITNLDQLPIPDYALIDFERYLSLHTPMNVILAKKRYTQIMTSRSCPYHCAYCHNIMGKGFRPRSAEHVLQEIEDLYHSKAIEEFHIIDDIFNLDRPRMHAILHGIINRQLKIKIAFPNAIRGDLLCFEDINLMAKAGVYNITFSLETASVRIQKLVSKNLNITKTMENIRYAHNIGIITKSYFMLGFPTETENELKQTLALALDPALDMISLFKVVPFAHTELAHIACQTWGEAPGETGQVDYFSGTTPYEKHTGIPLNRMILLTYLRFYLPFRIIKLFLKLPRKLLFVLRLYNHLSVVLHAGFAKRGRT